MKSRHWTAALALLLLPALAPAGESYTYVHHVVSTDRPEAQQAFDRGLTLMYGYSNQEAEQSFRLAAKLDPDLAMAWWGIALSLGWDINNDPDAANTKRAAEAIQHAGELVAKHGTGDEQAYIAALATRYSNDEQPDFETLANSYRAAMRSLVDARPGDADAAALYAEAIMDLRPWQLWHNDGTPAPDTEELVQMLETHLQRAPDHMGLLHMYIHTMEASAHPERALVAAHRLADQAMEPAAAHLIHMPSHIFLRVGDWASGIAANQHSIHHALDYRHSNQPAVAFACGHCQDFIRHADNMTGNLSGARAAAEELAKTLHDPTYLMGVLARFHQWDELLTQPEPPDENKPQQVNSHAARGFWHYTRGLALAATGRAARAEPELKALQAEAAQLPARFIVAPGKLGVGHEVEDMSRHADMENLALAGQVLRATLAEAQHRPSDAIALWRQAVKLQDQMLYSEPPIWYYPVRESLGGALLRQHEAAQAEAVFREDLQRNPHNPRSYFGLAAACKAQGRRQAAAEATAQFQDNWKFADSTLDLGSF